MLKQETRVALGVSKRLHGLSKTIAPILVSAYGAIGKDDASQAKKIVNLITKAQFDALGGYLQDEGLDTYQKGVLAAAEQLSKDANDAMVNLANQKGIDWAIDHAGDLITDFEDATKNDLQGIVTQALQEGWSNDQLAEKISDSWSFSASRAEVIARTETAFADVQGNLALYREAGIEKLVWLAADTAPCDECEALDGKTISVDGEMPPAHPNCRCDVAPVIPEKED